MFSRQELSVWLAMVLDMFGYSEKRVQERIWMSDKASLAKTISTQEITGDKHLQKFLVGSQREGLTLEYESDSDWLQVNKIVICTDKIKNIKGDRQGLDIVRIDTKNAPSGYTFLQYNTHDNYGRIATRTLQNALVETPNGYYLSSSCYMSINEDLFYNNMGYIGRNTVYMERNGPSIPKYVQKNERLSKWFLSDVIMNRDIDFVRGFECHYPALTNKWINRKRPHNWPSKKLLTQLADLPIHVVPVGVFGSPNEDLQWRFSFTFAEIALVRSFNETQRKMLIVLRHISKYLLEPIAPDMSSYIMKNVAFWISERTVTSKFSIGELVDRVLDAIDYLYDSVERRTLQHFFIQERNLLSGKLQGKQRKALMQKLKYIRLNGTKVLCEVLQSENIEREFPELNAVMMNKCWLNYIDKCDTLRLYSLSLSRLASFYTYCYYCNYHIMATIRGLPWPFLVFGTKWLTDPFRFTIRKTTYKPKIGWYWQRGMIRDRTNTKRLVKQEPCGWLLSIMLDFLYVLNANINRIAIFLYVLYVVYVLGMHFYSKLE